MIRNICLLGFILLICASCHNIQDNKNRRIAIDNYSPSKSTYFDWININWYGGNEKKVMNNLEFFKWLHETYGMQLDIYLLDAGNVDNGPNCSGGEEDLINAPRYGGIESEWFLKKYPHKLDSIYRLAKSFDCSLGLWIGPDGYGDSDSSAQQRINMLTNACEDYNLALFKMDKCCSDLDPKNEKYFINTLQKCYAINPELIVLNHRITLSDSARKYTTTFLLEGVETYIDVSFCNQKVSPHHRYTLERGLPPNLQRLTEDHGVCLSSYLDYWEDDLVLQAFNRNLILAPEIYGNPWLLNDEEFHLLARIFNLHQKYNSILTQAILLPENEYGPFAVSRGDKNTRLITLRNLSWIATKYSIRIDESIGLERAKKIEVRQYHPYEKLLGNFNYGQKIEIEVLPFRSCLLKISSHLDEWGIYGCNYEVVKDMPGQPVEVNLLAFPGEEKRIHLYKGNSKFRNASIDGGKVNQLIYGDEMTIKFPGSELLDNYHRLIGVLKETPIPREISTFFDVMYFATDNNCLEVRSLDRSGDTRIDAVQNARNAFFNDKVFSKIGAWDRFAFDNDTSTSFKVRKYFYNSKNSVSPGILRINLSEKSKIEYISVEGVESDYIPTSVYVSDNLKDWRKINFEKKNNTIVLQNAPDKLIKFIKLSPSPWNVSEIKAFFNNQQIDISESKANNLFQDNSIEQVKNAWKVKIKIGELTKNSSIAVAIEGDYGNNGAFAVIQTKDTLIGAFDRSPGYPANHWEHKLASQNGNYTYYFKLPENVFNSEITVYVIGLENVEKIKEPKVWLTAYPIPFETKRLVLEKY